MSPSPNQKFVATPLLIVLVFAGTRVTVSKQPL